MSKLAVLRAQLHAYRDFEECVVLDLELLDWGTSLKIDIDFVWRDDGTIRSEVEDRRIVSIIFGGVSEIKLVNDLTDPMVVSKAPKRWGLGEIALIRLEEVVLARSRLTIPSYRASFRREGYAWIELSFTEWEFSESAQSARDSPLND